MSNLGFGAMLHYLSGGTPNSASKYYGLTISAAEMKDDALHIAFDTGKKIRIFDDAQSCCEHRYMRTDDDLESLVGHKLTRMEVKPLVETDEDGGTHEIAFVEIGTDQGHITIANHNEHNGYYGGFGLSIVESGD